MKYLYLISFIVSLITVCGCQESMEDKAEREAKEYTRKYCPTPVINYTRTDSIAFSKKTHVYTYYITFVGNMDNRELLNEHRTEIQQMLTTAVHESTNMKAYVEAGFHFEYVCHSEKNPKEVLLKLKIQ